MIIGKISIGSGLGDMLFSYIATRVRAMDLGVDFGFVGKEFFKGKDFMNLDFGKEVDLKYHTETNTGKTIIDDEHKLVELNTPYFNPEFFFIEDGTVIDGYGAQDIKYFEHRLDEIREWLKVDPMLMPIDKCIINFRGGEFSVFPELFLTKDYWDEAINMMLEKNPKMRFEIHTDDPELASQFFPDYPIVSGIDINWRSIRYAKHLIVSNSAFAIIPALLGSATEVIAPRYWARRNIKEWSLPSNYYRKFLYI
jgi:hypothetical protein